MRREGSGDNDDEQRCWPFHLRKPLSGGCVLPSSFPPCEATPSRQAGARERLAVTLRGVADSCQGDIFAIELILTSNKRSNEGS